MKITFLGAAGEVTGSQHLIETDSRRILLDCGLFQGARHAARAKNEQFRCEPADVDAVVLSHAHIDHSGNLPGLYRAGFRGPVFCTQPTADIVAIMLRDSARIQQEDAKYLERKLRGEQHAPIEPLYSEADVRALQREFEPLATGEWHVLGEDFRLRFLDAGHILGSAISEMEILDAGQWRRIVYSGDLGQRDMPLLPNPETIDGCDVLICESTYGNRLHPPTSDLRGQLETIIRRAMENQGRVIIPAFSLGRTQLVLYLLNAMRNDGILEDTPVYVDSPLATRLTEVYRDHQEGLNEHVRDTLRTDDDAFDFPGLHFVHSRDESIALNRRPGPFVVISASGMCEFGRVVHHLKHAVSDSRNEIVIIGFQAGHTLGRRLLDGEETVRIFGKPHKVRARVEKINGLSAHADADDLAWWFRELATRGGADQVFLVHGEPEAAHALAELVRDDCNADPIVPELYQSFDV